MKAKTAMRKSEQVRASAIVERLRAASTAKQRASIARFGILTTDVLGVAMATIQKIGKELGRDHDLAHALWATGVYEARLLCAYVGDPERLTSAEADRWCRDFDNWGVCDTLCFCLFDRTPFAYRSAAKWCGRAAEFTKRAGFALLASLAGHDKKANDQAFLRLLPLCEKGAADDRNFVKKAVSWALRRTGGRSRVLHKACTELAETLAAADVASKRWVGKDVLRDLRRPRAGRRVAAAEKRRRLKGLEARKARRSENPWETRRST